MHLLPKSAADEWRTDEAAPTTASWPADGDVEALPTAEEIFDRPLVRAPWRASRPVLDIAMAAIPITTDDVAVKVIVAMAETIVDLREELQGVRCVQAAALGLLHEQQLTVTRLRARVSALNSERRAA